MRGMTVAAATQQTSANTRGDAARERLIAAAARLFASRGYDGVSVRDLAKAADVNVASVSYYFRGKRGLYLAALEALMEEMRPVGAPIIERVDAVFEGETPTRGALAETAKFVASHILTTMLSGDLEPWVTQTVLREFQEPTEDYRPMFDDRVLPLHKAIRRLAAAALDLEPDEDAAVLAGHGIMGQIMVFAAARRVVLEETGWDDFSGDRLDAVVRSATRSVLRSLSLSEDMETA